MSCGNWGWDGDGGYLQGQGYHDGSYDQNMTFYYSFLTVDSLAIKLGLMIHHQKPECPMKKIGLLHSAKGVRI